jgi:hypothetical protein
MYATRTQSNYQQHPASWQQQPGLAIRQQHYLAEPDVHARLNWLINVNHQEAAHRRRFRNALEEEQMRLMRRPVSTEKAYALLGTLVGLFPPAMVFYKILGYGVTGAFDSSPLIFGMCFLMNLICCLLGRQLASSFGKHLESMGRLSWNKHVLTSMLLGLGWGWLTGLAGGALFFGIGAIFGAFIATPIGIFAFTFYGLLHKLLARGGMIDARHLRPLAWGVAAIIAALILGI